MVDPVKRPITWNPKFQVYAEKHGIYDVFQELLKEVVIWKPDDVLTYLKEELPRIAKSIYKPKVFLLGPEPMTPRIGENIARTCGAKFITLEEIVETSPLGIRDHLREYLAEGETFDEPMRKLLIATMSRRLAMEDCTSGGYVLYGFPQSRAQAMAAQMQGLLPRQVFVLLPKGVGNQNEDVDSRTSTGAEDQYLPRLKNEVTMKDYDEYREYFRIKEVVSTFHLQHLKIIGHGRWSVTRPSDLEAEFLGAIVSKPIKGAPWIPRIILVGPPSSGKTNVAEFLSRTFNATNIDWTEIIRGASLWSDDVADELKQNLADLTPLTDETVKFLLKKTLGREDAVKKGWILQGFPETKRHAEIMDELGMTGNRIFLLSCPEAVSKARIALKREQIVARRLPGVDYPSGISIPGVGLGSENQVHNIGEFPFSEYAAHLRYVNFENNLDEVIAHFGTEMIFVDATQPPNAVREFVEASCLRPPNIRF